MYVCDRLYTTEIALHLRVKQVQAELSVACGGLCLNDWTIGHIFIVYAKTCETYVSTVSDEYEAILGNFLTHGAT